MLLTKADKLAQSESTAVLRKVQSELERGYANCTVQLFSATANRGVAEANTVVARWLESQEKSTEKTPGKGE